jgi:hypothetical protein
VVLCASAVFESAAFARPQTGSVPAIRVESGVVVVPTRVYYATEWDPNTGWSPKSAPGLAIGDFRLFEDGKEQKIQRIAVEEIYGIDVRDNFGVMEREWALTPEQKWMTLGRELFPWPAFIPVYVLAYVPAPSAEGSCHQVEVKVDRKHVNVYARDEYCNTAHSSSDPLDGTKISKQMEDDAASATAGKIRLSAQAGFLYTDPSAGRVYTAVEFPPEDLTFPATQFPAMKMKGTNIGILTMAYTKQGTLAARSSDLQGIYFPEEIFRERHSVSSQGALEDYVPAKRLDSELRRQFPDHHESQMKLAPGEYDLRVILSDGREFGRVEIQLAVDSYDGKQLGVSSIFLCDQFHQQSTTPHGKPEAPPSTLSDFVPLVSKGLEFTPAGHRSFTKDYLLKAHFLFAYYEIYEPLLSALPTTAVQTRMRIINTTTGALETDTGLRSAMGFMEPGKSVIPVSEQIAAAKLAKGSYRIEVQASDSTGRSTPWRTATFEVE